MVAIPEEKVAEVITASKAMTAWENIVERRVEVLLGTLIAHQLGLLDKLLVYGSGVCY